MRIGSYVKDPDEIKRYTIEYDAWLDTDEEISSVTFAVTPTTSPVLAVTGSSLEDDNRSVSFFVEGGVDGSVYTVTATMTSDGGQIKEDDIKFTVRE